MNATPPKAGAQLLAAAVASTALLLWSVPHTIEDFLYRVPEQRFGLSRVLALWGSGPLFGVQMLALLLLLAGRRRWGLWLLLLDGGGWAVAALLDHGGEVLRQPFRAGFSSTLWVGAIIVNGAVAAALAGWALRRHP